MTDIRLTAFRRLSGDLYGWNIRTSQTAAVNGIYEPRSEWLDLSQCPQSEDCGFFRAATTLLTDFFVDIPAFIIYNNL